MSTEDERALVPAEDKAPPPRGGGNALTAMQEAFAIAYSRNGGEPEAAAREAGYSAKTAGSMGRQLKRIPKIQQRIAEECFRLMADNVPLALAAQQELLRTGKSAMVKHLVAVDMLDRALGKAVQRVDQRISGEVNIQIDLG